MPESPEDLYARVLAAASGDEQRPMPPVHEWGMFPWEVDEGALRPRAPRPPRPLEPPRADSGRVGCFNCRGDGRAVRIWENDRWKVTRPPEPTGMPLVLWLVSRAHLDYPDLDDRQAAEYGRISVWLTRIMSRLAHVGRVHVCRWGDASEHLYVWFIGRPARMPVITGSQAVEWDELPPQAQPDLWLADVEEVARKLAHHDGRALI